MQNHPLMVLGTSAFLNRQPDFSAEGSGLTPAESLAKIACSPPDAVVMEVSINGPYDFSFLKNFRKDYPSLPILAYSYHEEVIFARRALEAGANGYLMKEAPPLTLAEALRKILAGEVYLSSRVTERMELEQQLREARREDQLNGVLINSLSNRELQIFQLLGDGFPIARIERELGLTPKSVRCACYRIRQKLGLKSEIELTQFARHWAYYEGDFA